jgi:hypothetical protein
MYTEGPGITSASGGYLTNPWDGDPQTSNQKLSTDARLQMSRTPDGKYLVYTWAESDLGFTTDQLNWNHLPDVKARVLDVTKGTLEPIKLDITSTAGGEIAGRAAMHFISPKCKFVSNANGPLLVLPMTVSNSTPYQQLNPNTHWYSCATLDFRTVGISENGSSSVNNSYIYPNPAKNNATVKVNLVTNSKVQIQVLNTIGQVVKTTQSQGQTGANSIQVDLSGLASGIYLVSVKVDNATSTKKLIVE